MTEAMTTSALLTLRPFPPVVHPRHAQAVLHGDEDIAAWVGAYALPAAEQRRLVEDLLAALAWGSTGQAVLVNGQYGAGKSHLLVLLHLLTAAPDAWEHFLQAHPTFRRYAQPLPERRLLVAHGSLDAYGPQVSLEDAVRREVTAALTAGGCAVPEALASDHRTEAWLGLQEAVQAQGHDGLLLLLDELSLFLAGKSHAQREADAAFLQFLAGWTARAPLWLVGTLQRGLGDTGALRAHSWRQVEDRFRRYALAPQELGDVLRDRLLHRPDPAGVRRMVMEAIVPAAERCALPYTPAALHAHWPLHPEVIGLLTGIAARHLSPHRSAVELLQRLGEEYLHRDEPRSLVTPTALANLVATDLPQLDALAPARVAWQALSRCAENSPHPEHARDLVGLLLLLHLADCRATVTQVRALCFDGVTTPTITEITESLAWLRRRGAYLGITRDADPAQEYYFLAINDDLGAEAQTLADERRQMLEDDDARVLELVIAATDGTPWAMNAERVHVSWLGSDRTVLLAPMEELCTAEAIRAGQADAWVCPAWGAASLAAWDAARPLLHDIAPVCWCWQPRARTAQEEELWREYAAWRMAADDPTPAATARQRRLRQRCREQADELRSAVAISVQQAMREGHLFAADATFSAAAAGASLTATLAEALAPAFNARYPVFAALAGNAPTRAETKLLLAQVIEPGHIALAAHAVLSDLVERVLLPLGCITLEDGVARVSPPAWEFLAPIWQVIGADPIALEIAVGILTRAPFGLTLDHARLALYAAVRSGALTGLDGFLRPLDPETTPWSRSDALVFLAAPPTVPDAHRDIVAALAARWEIPAAPWPLCCCRTLHRLDQERRQWASDVPVIHATLDAWTATLDLSPWCWVTTRRQLSLLERVTTAATSDAALATLAEEGIAFLDTIAQLRAACAWWARHQASVNGLTAWTWPTTLHHDAEQLRVALSAGEHAFPQLAVHEETLSNLLAAYTRNYWQWHEQAFGNKPIQALRQVFDSSAFRVLKLLADIPLPIPTAAQQCLQALTRARAVYCPGDDGPFATLGTCARCRLPMDTPSPLPDPCEVATLANTAIPAYHALFATHPWMETVRARVPRAPETVAARVEAWLAWQVPDGADSLLAIIDPQLLAWLCRDTPPAGARTLQRLQGSLQGRELTLGETRAVINAWLDPSGELTDEQVLIFE